MVCGMYRCCTNDAGPDHRAYHALINAVVSQASFAGCRRLRRLLPSDKSISTATRRTHAVGAAIDMAKPVMVAGTERITAPSTAMAVPTMVTAARLPPTNLTFQISLVSTPLHPARIASGWDVCQGTFAKGRLPSAKNHLSGRAACGFALPQSEQASAAGA